MSETPVAASGPAFATVTVNVIVSLGFGVASSTVLVTARSTAETTIAAESTSFAPSRSYSITPATDAVLVIVVPAVPVSTVATMTRETEPAMLKVPIVHIDPTYEPCEGVAETSVTPAGSASVSDTPDAGEGPALETVTV
ncbi:hypothetical protein BMS3Bbin02_01193 [bacterium BMS3Bbin02]|nr:hypothetical protein BMS3Bbin02_01193 [bacterium BMS3Bbin02]